jgi:Family of unknown function (DUF6335)
MAKRKAGRPAPGRKRVPPRSSSKRLNKKAKPARRAKSQKAIGGSKRTGGRTVTARPAKPAAGKTAKSPAAATHAPALRPKAPTLDRVRRTLNEPPVTGPPSALNMDRHSSSARTGRAELRERLDEHKSMGLDIAGGDIDVDLEDAYFTGDEAPGGDNSTPDQDIVDDIGKALGIEYQDNEELKAADKVIERDRNRWELDPASSEDYKERK